jgi:hypothetical protein
VRTNAVNRASVLAISPGDRHRIETVTRLAQATFDVVP